MTAPLGAATNGFDPPSPHGAGRHAFTLEFENEDPVQHNVVIKDPDGADVPMGDTAFFAGPETRAVRRFRPWRPASTRTCASSTRRR